VLLRLARGRTLVSAGSAVSAAHDIGASWRDCYLRAWWDWRTVTAVVGC
jgi:hypothetical protein